MNHLPYPDFRRPQLSRSENRIRAFPSIPFRPTGHNGQIFLVCLAPFKNPAQLAGGVRVLRHQDDAAGFTIQSGHDPQAGAILYFERQQLLQAAQKCRLRLAIRRMDDQGRGFIHDDPVVGLGNHLEIDHDLQAHDSRRLSSKRKARDPDTESLAIAKQINPKD
ncbi:MAG: hypothetical protein V4584_14530 [Verrucomicrobiota bacterium]